MKILAYDLELSPNVADVWGLFKQNVSLTQLRESQQMMCWAATWIDQPGSETMFASSFHDGREAMVRELYNLIDEADILVGWNSKSFDYRHAKREFLENGFTPPSPVQHIDLMLTCRKQFLFPSNKLDYVANRLLGVGKEAHAGHQLWVECMADIPEAWDKMKSYCIQDVDLLPPLYKRLLPWIEDHPTLTLADNDEESLKCPRCKSDDITFQGYRYTRAIKYRRIKCKSCHGWSRVAATSNKVIAQ